MLTDAALGSIPPFTVDPMCRNLRSFGGTNLGAKSCHMFLDAILRDFLSGGSEIRILQSI